jgi:uncharacterized protein HemX
MTMPSKHDAEIAALAQKLKQAKARREAAEKRELAKATRGMRSIDARRKIILGGWLLANHPELVRNAIQSLEREHDVEAFAGWTPPERSRVAA